MRAARWLIVALVTGLALAGIARLRVDTDILAMLPADLPEVRGLRTLQQEFSRAGELVVLLECDEEHAGTLTEAAADLASRLEAAGTAKRARWQPAWDSDPGDLAEVLAYLWLNGDPQALRALAARLAPDQAAATLTAALGRVATSFEGVDLALRAHDPFGLLEQAALTDLIERQGAGGGFSSPDERAHVLLVDAPRPIPGYRAAAAWLAEVSAVVDDWRAAGHQHVAVSFTGDPAFNAEIGGSIEHDMTGTLAVTTLLIGAMFWWMQRRLALLGAVGAMLGLVFVLTLGAAGWMFPHGLGVMSAGFAAVLIGLVIDYGVLICQEAKVERHDPAAIRHAVTRSIGWAAGTTAAVFAALKASSLPGIGQLGLLVATGILAGAGVMLGLFVPLAARIGAGRPQPTAATRRGPFLTSKAAWAASALAALAAVVLIARHGAPSIEFDFALMRPRDSAAMAAFERVRAAFPGWDSHAVKVVVAGRSQEETAGRLATAARQLDSLRQQGLAAEAWLPAAWWPNPAVQQLNRRAAAALAADRPRLLDSADAAGFTTEGAALGAAVLESFGRLATRDGLMFPDSEVARELMRGFLIHRPDGSGVVLGDLTPQAGALDHPALRAIQDGQLALAGWDALRPAILPLVRRDLRWVFLPMAGVMLAMLVVVFRRPREVALEVLSLGFSMLVLCGIMAAADLHWNFLNVAALPLLLGTGVDYGIHMLLALRRSGGDFARAWHGTGKAVVFCGVSTAIGFGSLSLASNEAMSSMGIVCATGILVNMLTALFLLPGWRGTTGPHHEAGIGASPAGAED